VSSACLNRNACGTENVLSLQSIGDGDAEEATKARGTLVRRRASNSTRPSLLQALNEVLDNASFDLFCETSCAGFYHHKLGRPSLPPGQYFHVMMIGFFEGLDSERGIAWRLADSLTLRQFLSIGLDENTPDHVILSRSRRLIDGRNPSANFHLGAGAAGAGRAHPRQDDWRGFDHFGSQRGHEIDCAPRHRRELHGVLAAPGRSRRNRRQRRGSIAPHGSQAEQEDFKRNKKTSNEDWESPSDQEAEITKRKDGRTALAYKAENAVDMGTGAIVAVTTHGGAAADTATVQETVVEAAIAVAGLTAEKTSKGESKVPPEGVEEVVADKGYHSNEVALGLAEIEVRTYLAEPDRGPRNWDGKAAEKAAVCTPIGAFRVIAASGCSGNGESGSNGTSHINLIPADWTGSMCEAWRTCTRNS
jgi:transposase